MFRISKMLIIALLAALATSLTFGIHANAQEAFVAVPSERAIPSGQAEAPIQAPTAQSAAKRPEWFYPHISSSSQTVGHMKFAIQALPSAAYSNFVYSLFSLGLGDRLQLGTSPIFYFVKDNNDHAANATAKYNFFYNSQFSTALASTVFTYKPRVNRDPFLVVSLLGNFHPEGTPWSFGTNVGLAGLQRLDFDFLFDASYKITQSFRVTVGGSRNRLGNLDKTDGPSPWGYGGSFTYLFPQKFVSRIALGYHVFPAIDDGAIQLGLGFM